MDNQQDGPMFGKGFMEKRRRRGDRRVAGAFRYALPQRGLEHRRVNGEMVSAENPQARSRA